MKQNYKIQSGVTLIELMLAVAISLILLLGVGSVYYNSKKTYLVQEEFARLQENSRFALKFMVEDIRMAGYIGCAWNNNLNYENFLDQTGIPADDDPYNRFNIGIEGLEADNTYASDAINLAAPAGAWDAAVSNFIDRPPLQGSDILIVRYADGNGVQLAANNDAANLWIDDLDEPALEAQGGGVDCHVASGICEGDILLVTDCEKSRLFQATNGMAVNNPGGGGPAINIVHANGGIPEPPGNATPNWNTGTDSFSPDDSFIFRARAYAYYVAIGTGTNGEPSLFRQELRQNSQPQELVEGVENMQILYGIDTDKADATQTGDGIANRYVSADLINLAADNVVSARISLLLRTANEINTKTDVPAVAKDFILGGMSAANGTTVTSPADRRLRKVFTTTVKIRNKGLQ